MIEEWINDLEDKVVEITQEKRKKEFFKKEDILKAFWDNVKSYKDPRRKRERKRHRTYLKK